MREAKTFDIGLLLLLGVIWGSSFFNIKIASYSYEPFTLALVRVIFASIPLIVLCFYRKIKIKAFSKDWKNYALIGGCNIVVPFSLIARCSISKSIVPNFFIFLFQLEEYMWIMFV